MLEERRRRRGILRRTDPPRPGHARPRRLHLQRPPPPVPQRTGGGDRPGLRDRQGLQLWRGEEPGRAHCLQSLRSVKGLLNPQIGCKRAHVLSIFDCEEAFKLFIVPS